MRADRVHAIAKGFRVTEANELTLRADATEALRASAWLEAHCMKHGVPHEHVARLLLCLDDAFANVVAHGGPSALVHPIRLHFAMRDEPESRTASVTLSDGGAAFDPVSAPEKPSATTLDDAVPNGRGLRMIRASSSVLRYRREGGRNHLTFGTCWRHPANLSLNEESHGHDYP
jgi:serine/threonine-protein kinase RsbW